MADEEAPGVAAREVAPDTSLMADEKAMEPAGVVPVISQVPAAVPACASL
jgi:hypothetical protein